ncbi:hypothetical protein Lsan_2674 [Legionella santicrucis]|uniref:Uncharacterized protein n=1 Tax=Legionella santicrucis TaxID=45074 RepID=A0A0W0YJG8_9GAMM|nr:hypothetical protein [Legionella santicrucis]KTD57052.1 hypothetical protein Lsan_2674 [Legionella santicrucis]
MLNTPIKELIHVALREILNKPYLLSQKELSSLEKMVPTDFRHPTTFDWKNPLMANHYLNKNHGGGKDAINVHQISLDADKKQWLAGAWFILLPNLMLSLTNNLKESLESILVKQLSFNMIRYINAMGITTEQKKCYRYNQCSIYHSIIEKMEPLFSLFIMCKRFDEIKRENIVINVLMEHVAEVIISTLLDTLMETLKEQKTPQKAVCNSANEHFDILHNLLSEMEFDELIFDKTSSHFNQVVGSIIDSAKKGDLEEYLNQLNLDQITPSELQSRTQFGL